MHKLRSKPEVRAAASINTVDRAAETLLLTARIHAPKTGFCMKYLMDIGYCKFCCWKITTSSANHHMLLSFLLWQKYFLKIFPLWGCYGGWLGFVLKLCWNSNVKMATHYANVDTIITSSQKLKQLSANQILQLQNKTIWCQLQFNLGSTLHFLDTILIFN